jgi:hypothetical protein
MNSPVVPRLQAQVPIDNGPPAFVPASSIALVLGGFGTPPEEAEQVLAVAVNPEVDIQPLLQRSPKAVLAISSLLDADDHVSLAQAILQGRQRAAPAVVVPASLEINSPAEQQTGTECSVSASAPSAATGPVRSLVWSSLVLWLAVPALLSAALVSLIWWRRRPS